MPDVLDQRNRPTRLINRRDIDTRNRGLSLITKMLASAHLELESSTGIDEGTGDVKLRFKRTGVRAGRYNVVDVDVFGRITGGQWVAPSSGGGGVDVSTVIRNQFSQPQAASMWISGSARVDGVTVLQTLNLGTPLTPTSGGTGASSASAGQVFAGPALGPGEPGFRLLAVTDLPNAIPASKLSLPLATNSTPGLVRPGVGLSIDGAGILTVTGTYTLAPATTSVLGGVIIGAGLAVDAFGVVTASVPDLSGYVTTASAQSISGVKSFQSAPVISAGLEVASGAPGSTVNKIYQVAGALFWNGSEVGSTYTLPVAAAGVLGGVRIGSGLAVDGSGILSWTAPANTATTDTTQTITGSKTFSEGFVVADATPSVTTNRLYNVAGALYWNGSAIGGSYTLPTAAAGVLGGVRVGSGLAIDGSGILSAPAPANMVTTDTTQTITGAKTFSSVLTVDNRSVFASTMSVHGSVNTILVTANHDQSTGSAWSLTAATRFKSGAGAASDGKGHAAFTTFQDGVTVATTGLNKARGFYAVSGQNDASNSTCGTYYGYSTVTGSGTGVTTFTDYVSFAVDDEIYANAAFSNRYGLLVKTGNVTPSSSWYGVYIQDGPASPVRYSIYTGTAPSRFGGGLELPSFTPSSTANALYNVAGALYWNGAAVGGSYSLPTATGSVLGGVKVGARLSIDGAGVLSADIQGTALTVVSITPAVNTNASASWIGKYTRIAPSASVNIVIVSGIAAVGDRIEIFQANSTFFTLAAGAGVSLQAPTTQSTITARAMYSTIVLTCVATDTWDVTGDITP